MNVTMWTLPDRAMRDMANHYLQRRNCTSALVWSVVLFLFISSSGCALLKQSQNKTPLYDLDSISEPPADSNKPLKSLHTKLLENRWLGPGFCLTTQYIVYILLPDTRYTYICGGVLGAIYASHLKVIF